MKILTQQTSEATEEAYGSSAEVKGATHSFKATLFNLELNLQGTEKLSKIRYWASSLIWSNAFSLSYNTPKLQKPDNTRN